MEVQKAAQPSQDDTVAPVVKELVQDAEKGIGTENDLTAYRMMDYFDLSKTERQDGETLEQLKAIYDWGVKETGEDDSYKVMQKIADLSGRLGLTFRPSEKLSTLYRYIKLDSQRKDAELKMKMLHGA